MQSEWFNSAISNRSSSYLTKPHPCSLESFTADTNSYAFVLSFSKDRAQTLFSARLAICTKPMETELSWSPVHRPRRSPTSFLSSQLQICLQTTSLIGVGKCFDSKNVCNTWKTTLRFKEGGNGMVSKRYCHSLSCLR